MSLENIDTRFIFIALFILLAVIIVVCLAKKLIKIAIVVFVALLLFNIVFVLDGTEIREKFKLDEIVSTEQAGFIENLFNKFADRRDELAVIDTKKLYDEMVKLASDGAVIVVDGAKQIYKNVFADNINKLIEEYKEDGGEINIDELKQAIKDAFPGISDDDVGDIVEDALGNKEDTSETTVQETAESETELLPE